MVQQPGSPSDSMLNLSFADVVRCGVVRSCRALTQRSQPGEVYRAPVLHQQGCRDNDRAPERPRKREGPRPGRQVAGAAMVGRDFHHLHRADDDPLSQKYAPGTVASFITSLIFIYFFNYQINIIFLILNVTLIFIFSIYSIDKYQNSFDEIDSKVIVIDEFVGQSIPILTIYTLIPKNNMISFISIFSFLLFYLDFLILLNLSR